MKPRTLKAKKKSTQMSLRDTQRLMGSVIMGQLTADQRTPEKQKNGRSTAAIAEEIIKPNSKLTSVDRLEIYNRQYWFRLIDCLYDDFTGLRALLGEKKFYRTVEAYLLKHPSSSYLLRDLGEHMEQFLKQQPQWAGKRLGICLEMARFEWAQVIAFDEAAYPPIKPHESRAATAGKLTFILQPYISILDLSYPLDDFKMALHQEKSHRAEAARERKRKADGSPALLPRKEKTYLVVHRFDNSLYYKRIDAPSYRLLKALKDGKTLEQACNGPFRMLLESGQTVDEASRQLSKWFETWGYLRWFCEKPPSVTSRVKKDKRAGKQKGISALGRRKR